MYHAYIEDQIFEEPSIGLFAELGWQTVSFVGVLTLRRTPQPRMFSRRRSPRLDAERGIRGRFQGLTETERT